MTAGAWESADLRQLVQQTLAPHGGIGDRIHACGPVVTLLPEVTLGLALALHELATNAAKYGALTTPAGHIELTWEVSAGRADDDRRFSMHWREIGGPVVQAPTRTDFGSTMIERSLRSYFHGEAQLSYPASGVEFVLECALPDAGTANE